MNLSHVWRSGATGSHREELARFEQELPLNALTSPLQLIAAITEHVGAPARIVAIETCPTAIATAMSTASANRRIGALTTIRALLARLDEKAPS